MYVPGAPKVAVPVPSSPLPVFIVRLPPMPLVGWHKPTFDFQLTARSWFTPIVGALAVIVAYGGTSLTVIVTLAWTDSAPDMHSSVGVYVPSVVTTSPKPPLGDTC